MKLTMYRRGTVKKTNLNAQITSRSSKKGNKRIAVAIAK